MSNWRIRRAVLALKCGNVIAYPTEAVYGLGVDPWNEDAVLSLLKIKGRSWQKGLIVVAANRTQLAEFILPLSIEISNKVEASWPGPTTWVLPAKKSVPTYLRGENDTIAVRITAHRQTAELCRQFGGAVVSTSANITNGLPAKTAEQVQHYFPEIKTILPGKCYGAEQPTQIKDGQTGDILR